MGVTFSSVNGTISPSNPPPPTNTVLRFHSVGIRIWNARAGWISPVTRQNSGMPATESINSAAVTLAPWTFRPRNEVHDPYSPADAVVERLSPRLPHNPRGAMLRRRRSLLRGAERFLAT